MAKFLAYTFASFTAVAAAQSFLAKSTVKQQLLSQLLGRSDVVQLQSIQDELRPMYAALPKSEGGLLEEATVRYALNRYFLSKYGWSVKGLDVANDAGRPSGATSVLKERASAYILSLFEEHLNGAGLGLNELAVFAATLTDLIHSEAIGQLQKIFSVLRLPTVGPVEPSLARSAMSSFIVAHLLGSGTVIESLKDLPAMKARLDRQYPNQEETNMWVEDLKHTYIRDRHPRRNPFVKHNTSFDEASQFVKRFGQSFGSFQNLECHALKQKLVDMEYAGSGRVPLSRYYAKALAGDWNFMESVEYLRHQGVLDETDPRNPSVVIPNYMNGRINCLTASDYYAVCCLNECDALYDRLEAKVAAPHGEAERIAEVVSNLQSDTVDAPRNLSTPLLARLDQIAQQHAGRVPLHGRLFAQWMHHVYPRECPFPHVSGTVTPMTMREFGASMGPKMLAATRDVLEYHAARTNPSDEEEDEDDVELPWSEIEELVAEHRHVPATTGFVPTAAMVAQLLAATSGLASFMLPLMRFLKGEQTAKVKKQWV